MHSPLLILSTAFVLMGAGFAGAQSYPSKPIRIYTGGAGGSNDIASRLIANGISGPLGQQIIVENRGSGLISIPIVAQSPPDGYSLSVAGDLIWAAPLLRENIPWDMKRDFAPISMLASAPNVLVVHPSLPVKSVKDLIALARARPRELNYSTSGSGGIDHIAGELFKSTAGVNTVWVAFKGGVPATTAVISGEVQLAFLGVPLVSPHVKSGRLKALAITSAQPSTLMPGFPTMAASGVPGFDLAGTDAIYAPAKTPPAIISQLNREIVRFLKTKDAQEKYLSLGSEVIASSVEEHAAMIQSRITVIGKVIKEAGIKAE